MLQLWSTFHEARDVIPSLKESLAMLQLDYVDLYLIHWPIAFKVQVKLSNIKQYSIDVIHLLSRGRCCYPVSFLFGVYVTAW